MQVGVAEGLNNCMKPNFDDIIPVMQAPFTQSGDVDNSGLAILTEWYLDAGGDTSFAVCQPSEMQLLLFAAAIGFPNHRLLGEVVVSGQIEKDCIRFKLNGDVLSKRLGHPAVDLHHFLLDFDAA